MQRGDDLTYGAVAAQAGVRERTVYRHFPTKADLEAGLWSWITDHLTHFTFDAGSEEELIAAMRRSFAGFDAGAPLIQAMLHSRQGLAVRRQQQAARRDMFERCAGDALRGAPRDVLVHAAAALQLLYSAQAWELLRTFWGMDASEASTTVELAMRALLSGLRTSTSPGHERTGAQQQPRGSEPRERRAT